MNSRHKNHRNDLLRYRERLGLTQAQVNNLLGLKNSKLLSKLEQEHRTPRLATAMKLSAIYRTPIEFLFPGLYEAIRTAIRMHEETLKTDRKEEDARTRIE